MVVPVMAISNLVLSRQIYSEETNGAHAHYREPVPLITMTMNQSIGWREPLPLFMIVLTILCLCRKSYVGGQTRERSG